MEPMPCRTPTTAPDSPPQLLTQAVRDGVQDLKFYTTIEDIRRQDALYTRMENRGNGF